MTMSERGLERRVRIPGDIEAERAAEIEEAIWDRLHFATHLRSQRLGEYTIGMDLHRSESLALVQLLILYHLVTGRAAVALGREARARGRVRPRSTAAFASPLRRKARNARPPAAPGRAPGGSRTTAGAAAARRRARPEQSQLDLEMRRQPRLQRDAEARAGGLLDGAVGAEGAHRRVQVVAGEELLGHRARARALLAQQPRARSELLHAHAARLASGSSGAVMTTIGLSRKRSATKPSSAASADGDVGPMRAQPLEDALAIAHVDAERDLRMAGMRTPA